MCHYLLYSTSQFQFRTSNFPVPLSGRDMKTIHFDTFSCFGFLEKLPASNVNLTRYPQPHSLLLSHQHSTHATMFPWNGSWNGPKYLRWNVTLISLPAHTTRRSLEHVSFVGSRVQQWPLMWAKVKSWKSSLFDYVISGTHLFHYY